MTQDENGHGYTRHFTTAQLANFERLRREMRERLFAPEKQGVSND